jgi:hypothetical protein
MASRTRTRRLETWKEEAMPVTQARIGHGTLLKRGNGATPELFETIAEVTSITPPQMESDDIEVTHMESPGGYKEYIPGLREAGEVSFEVNFLPAHPTHNGTTGLAADHRNRTIRNWRIELAGGGAVWTFPGYVKTFNVSIPVDDKVPAAVTLKVTGEPILAAA